ncbi:MAG: hypothetical protein LBG87_03580 [Spirochaetaceae bacterium]|nr:hypothetical protein [Spirochaetaceae bacterium]
MQALRNRPRAARLAGKAGGRRLIFLDQETKSAVLEEAAKMDSGILEKL